MNSYYYISLTLETEIRKTEMPARFNEGSDDSKASYLKQFDEIYPQSLYNHLETHDSYVFSFKDDLPSSILMDLRDCVYLLLDILPTQSEKIKEDGIKQKMSDGNVGQMIKLSQQYSSRRESYYDRLAWISYQTVLPLDSDDSRPFTSALLATNKGIQIYRSYDYFETEDSGELWILASPLAKILRPSKYKDLISIRIEDNM